MRLSIEHTTTYAYDIPVRRVIQLLRVTPASFTGQSVLDWRVDVDCDAQVRDGRDGYGNCTHMIYVDQPITSLSISVSGRILTENRTGLVQGLPHDLPPPVFLRSTDLTAATAALEDFARLTLGGGGSDLDRLHRLNGEIHGIMRFDAGATTASTTAGEAFDQRHGVCQDFAHIFLAAARFERIPVRYVSGHLFRRDGSQRQRAGHAWIEAWIDELGWIAFDPTHGLCTDDSYVRVACGLDYADASPVAGRRSGGGSEELEVAVEVRKARDLTQQHLQGQQ